MSQHPDDPRPPGGAPWDETSDKALRAAIPHHMDGRSAALYARWWQLETWLRDLLYLELRAHRGIAWESAVAASKGRLTQDSAYTHMEGPDSDNPMAYLDFSQLVAAINTNWGIVGYGLLSQTSWDGRQDDLARIRHRIGHMRRPHIDDLARLEQTLRDLERGAFIAFASYSDRATPEGGNDPVSVGWIQEHHQTARRLTRHARDQYETWLTLRTSQRPWAQGPPTDLSHAPGTLWHADFSMRGRHVDLPALWRDVTDSPIDALLVHLAVTDPHHVGFTFSAADDPTAVAEAIGEAFDYVLMNQRRTEFDWDDVLNWQLEGRRLGYRVMAGIGWTMVDEATLPWTTFDAGNAVNRRPRP